ncbi:MAG: hypothetical protein IJC76_02765 [Lachnospiraceae bacterium]|nr:hypothetical protein [Lachnospiraceae bacterium]
MEMDNVVYVKEEKNNGKKKRWIVVLAVIVGILLLVASVFFELYMIKKRFNDSLIELDNMNDGKMHNIAEMYKNAKYASYLMDTDEFYEKEIIKEVENLNGAWAVRAVTYDGVSSGARDDIYFQDGVRIIKAVILNRDLETDIYYKDGVFYIGKDQSGEEYAKLVDYDGAQDDAMIIEERKKDSMDEKKYVVEQQHLAKRLN